MKILQDAIARLKTLTPSDEWIKKRDAWVRHQIRTKEVPRALKNFVGYGWQQDEDEEVLEVSDSETEEVEFVDV